MVKVMARILSRAELATCNRMNLPRAKLVRKEAFGCQFWVSGSHDDIEMGKENRENRELDCCNIPSTT